MQLNNFDANTVQPAGEFTALPEGTYVVCITDSEERETKSGNGHYLQMTLEVIDGDFEGRLLWARLNLDNPSAKAVQIAKGQLSAICRAVEVMTPQDSSELHDIPLCVKVKQREYEGTMRNEVAAFKPVSTAEKAPGNVSVNDSAPWAK